MDPMQQQMMLQALRNQGLGQTRVSQVSPQVQNRAVGALMQPTPAQMQQAYGPIPNSTIQSQMTPEQMKMMMQQMGQVPVNDIPSIPPTR